MRALGVKLLHAHNLGPTSYKEICGLFGMTCEELPRDTVKAYAQASKLERRREPHENDGRAAEMRRRYADWACRTSRVEAPRGLGCGAASGDFRRGSAPCRPTPCSRRETSDEREISRVIARWAQEFREELRGRGPDSSPRVARQRFLTLSAR